MELQSNVCYLHSGSSPVTYLLMYQCPAGKYCDIADSSKYAWFDAQYQQYSSGKSVEESQVFGQNTIGYCRSTSTIDVMLNNGRQCAADN